MLAPTGDGPNPGSAPLRAKLLGPFAIFSSDKVAGPWPRPTAKRLCELVLLSPGRRVVKGVALEAIFPSRDPAVASRALSTALSNARTALAPLGQQAAGFLRADRTYIWADPACRLEIDLDLHKQRLERALRSEPGPDRDDLLILALADEGTLLEDERYADWAMLPREELERSRHDARLTLARDRARGFGCCSPEAVGQAWEKCFSHDPACEEAACALMRLYAAQTRWALVEGTYRRCISSLGDLGIRASPAVEEVYAASTPGARPLGNENLPAPPATRWDREQRTVTCLFVELGLPVATAEWLSPEDLSERVGSVLGEVVASVELFGGTVTAASGAGLVGLFGAPAAHEDDPERALRAAYRALETTKASTEGLSLRAGVETGQAIVGPLLGGGPHYGAVGQVVATAAALQSVTKAASVLVGPATYAGTVDLFEWGPTEEVACVPGAKPLRACYLERPQVRPAAQASRRRLAGQVPVVGREVELGRVREALRDATLGKGGAVLISGEPGLGKTRVVQECRRFFMAWAGARSGRLPLWLEGRAASYSASRPYGLYQQLLSVWAGVALEENRHTVRAALLRSLKAIFGRDPDDECAALLLVAMGIDQRENNAVLAQLNAEQLQRATFEAVGAVVSRLVSNGPTVLVLEDLHWADPTSLRLTEALSAVIKKGPLLLVMTSRPEPDPGVSALEINLATDPDLRLLRLQLSPLPQDAERKLVTSLLGGGTPDDIVDAVSRGAEGNPLFIEERFSSLLETRALSRDEVGWHIDRSLSVQVPEALERIVRSRVDRLAVGPRQAIVAASVLGPEFDAGALSTVTDLGPTLEGAISELCASRLLVEVQKGPGPSYRFRHGVIQEATYKGLLRGDRRRLHARAAWGLESSSSGRLEDVASQLGHHFAMAGEDGRAVHYLDVAGDQAAAAYANDEAIASYRYVLDLLAPGTVDGTGMSGSVAVKAETETRIKLAYVFLLVGRYSEASQTLREGLGVTGTGDRLNAARLHNKLGWVEVDRHAFDAAANEFAAASTLLGDKAADSEVEIFDLWFQAHQGLVHVHYWRDEPDELAIVMARIASAFNGKSPPRRWQRQYFQALMLWQLAERRHRVDEEILENTRKYLEATEECSEIVDIGVHPLEVEIGWAVFCLGVCLILYGDLDGGEERLHAALGVAERTGSAAMRALCLSYLNLAALRRNDTSAVALLAPQAMDAAYMASRPQYAATAKATLAWMAWKTGSLEDVEGLAQSALALWPAGSWQPFHWVCLWPLIAVRLASGHVAGAVEAARQLLPAPQQRLPDELEDVVKTAIEAWEIGDAEGASNTLANALDLAQQLRYA